MLQIQNQNKLYCLRQELETEKTNMWYMANIPGLERILVFRLWKSIKDLRHRTHTHCRHLMASAFLNSWEQSFLLPADADTCWLRHYSEGRTGISYSQSRNQEFNTSALISSGILIKQVFQIFEIFPIFCLLLFPISFSDLKSLSVLISDSVAVPTCVLYPHGYFYRFTFSTNAKFFMYITRP